MANDRYDTRDTPRDARSRWSGDRSADRYSDRDRGRSWSGDRDRDDRRDPDDRGFFERAGDHIASWFGDDEAEWRRREDQLRDERERGYRATGSSERDYDPNWRREPSGGGERERFRDRGRDYRPMTGDYGRSEQFFAASGGGRGERGMGDYGRDMDRSESQWGRDEYRRTSRAGIADPSDRSRHEDPHYRSWRDRHLGELDRDYDEYRRENQSRFEDDFSSWRERRQQKRGLLGVIREQMEVVGSDDQPVGTVDRVISDRIILAKSDPDSGGSHHSLSCSDVDRVEDDRVILDCTAEQARQRWRDETRSRALFEREDQGEMGPRMLDRSFEGTYR